MKLFFTDGQKKGDKYQLTPPGISIGRELDNDIILELEGASRYHAKLEWKDSNWYLKDLGSTNGTQLNGERIAPNTELKLKEGDSIKIGRQTIFFAEKLDKLKEVAPSLSLATDSSEQIATAPSAPTISNIPLSTKEQQKGKGEAAKPESILNLFGNNTSDKKEGVANSETLDFFRKQDSPNTNKVSSVKKQHPGMLFYFAVIGTAMLLIAGFLFFEQTKENKTAKTIPTKKIRKGTPLLLIYEKQITTLKPEQNIFRYLLEIKNGVVTVTRDDLRAGLKDQLSRKVSSEKLLELEDKLRETNFMSLTQKQLGLPRGGEDKLQSLTIAYGEEFNSITVRNSSSSHSFEEVVRILEDDFSDKLLNIPAISLTPAELREDGMRAYIRGKELFENYRARNENLFKARKLLKVAIEYLGSFQPEPPEYHEAYKMREEASRILLSQLRAHERNAINYFKLKEFVKAKEEYQMIMEKSEPGSKNYNDARERIIILEENIRRRKK